MNKQYLKVASIIATVSGVLLLISSAFNLISYLTFDPINFEWSGMLIPNTSQNWFLISSISSLIFGILNFIARFYLNKAIKDETSREVALGWSIYLIFTAWIVGGIFGILGANGSGVTSDYNDLEANLSKLKKLLDQGVITSEEYEIKRKALIEKI